jgi:poly-gamma-glutamate synthesis protein (capsule biosynthesis protein)
MDGSVLPNPPTRWQLPATNRDPSRLTTLAMTGVTAMVRGTAWMMDHYGITYPAQDIASLLRSADLTHISNEIPFSASCPTPEIYPTELIFCSDPSYIALLEEIGTDFIELTGDHFGDYGIEATLYTLDIYRERGWPYYGGGVNADEARQPLLIEHNGNRLAFLGCNIGCQVKTEVPCTALATAERPGAAQCDFEWLEEEIPRLRSDGYQVIVTFQHKEYYTYTAQPNLVADFGRVAQAGAILVSGSQAHQAHGLAFEYGALIHYGLGNLFFDQVNFCADYACNYAFIDRHVFYQNRLVSTELIPLRFLDMARSRLMTPEETAQFLEIINSASGW